jgi:hypothetical protein
VRYYDIAIDGGPHFSSLTADGQNDPNALRVKFTIEYDSVVLNANTSFVSIYGIDIDVMRQANNYNGKRITVNGGFWPGLPLASLQALPPRRGLLAAGIVAAAAGNWRGNDISLDLLMSPTGGPKSGGGGGNGGGGGGGNGGGGGGGGGNGAAPQSQSPSRSSAARLLRRSLPKAIAPGITPRDGNGGGFGGFGDVAGMMSTLAQGFGGGFLTTPANLIHNLNPGQWLGDAISQTLTTAYPGTSVLPLLSKSLKTNYQDSGFYENLQQLTGYYKQLGQTLGALGGGTSGTSGIDTFIYDNRFIVTDWTQSMGDVTLAYTDLIGQPTWVAFNEVFFSSVLRADLLPVKTVGLPVVPSAVNLLGTPVLTGEALILSQARQLIFNGSVTLYKVRHVGDSRSPDGAMWRTDCWGRIG